MLMCSVAHLSKCDFSRLNPPLHWKIFGTAAVLNDVMPFVLSNLLKPLVV